MRAKVVLVTLAATNTALAVLCARFAVGSFHAAPRESLTLLGVMAFCAALVWLGSFITTIAAIQRRSAETISVAHHVGSQAVPALFGLMLGFLLVNW